MKYRSDLILALAALLWLASAQSAAAQGEYGRRLADAELQALAPADYAGTYKDKLQLVIQLKPNGKATGTADGKFHRGTWRVKNGEFCLTVHFLVFRKTKCSAVFQNGDSYFGMFNKHGKPRLKLRAIASPSG